VVDAASLIEAITLNQISEERSIKMKRKPEDGITSRKEMWLKTPFPAHLSGPVRKLSPEEIAAYEKQLASRDKMGK
jgi:hypothetical protein